MAKDRFANVDYDRYEQHLARRVAESKLKTILHQRFPNSYCHDEGFRIQMHGRLEQGRGGAKFDTTLTALKEKGVILSWDRKDVGTWRQTDYRYFIEISPSWYEEYAKDHQKEPTFKLKKTIEKRKSYGSTTDTVAASEIDGYRSIDQYNDNFDCDEMIYLLNHIDDYDFRECSKTHNYTKYHRSSTSYWVVCYPHRQHKDLAKSVFDGHLEMYVQNHFETVVEHLFNLNPAMVMADKPSTFINYRDDHEKWTPKKTQRMIDELEAWRKYADEYVPLLRQILAAFDGRTPEELIEQTIPIFRAYMDLNFPCHLEDGDKELKQLAIWMVQGKHQGKLTEMV